MPDRGAKLGPARTDALRVVHVEDCVDDAELVSLELLASGFVLDYLRVDDEAQLLAALASFGPTMVLSDFNLPGFCGARALELVREHGRGVPFVFFTGSVDSHLSGPGDRVTPDAVVLKDDLRDLPSRLRQILAGVVAAA